MKLQSLIKIFKRYKKFRHLHQWLKILLKHTVRNLHFLSKNSTLISRENCRFFGRKSRENVVVLDYLAVDNFDFTRKIVKKYLCEKLVKLNFWTKNEDFEQCAFVFKKKQNCMDLFRKGPCTFVVCSNLLLRSCLWHVDVKVWEIASEDPIDNVAKSL